MAMNISSLPSATSPVPPHTDEENPIPDAGSMSFSAAITFTRGWMTRQPPGLSGHGLALSPPRQNRLNWRPVSPVPYFTTTLA